MNWIKGPRILEIGSGPGHLLANMAVRGLDVHAIDVSPQMTRQARGRLQRQNLQAGLVRGRAQALPWPDAAFDSVVMTFPAGFVLEPAALGEMRRVLHPEGRLVIVDGAQLKDDLYGRIVNLAFRLTGGSGEAAQSATRLFEGAGFGVTIEEERWPDSTVKVIVASPKKVSAEGDRHLFRGHTRQS